MLLSVLGIVRWAIAISSAVFLLVFLFFAFILYQKIQPRTVESEEKKDEEASVKEDEEKALDEELKRAKDELERFEIICSENDDELSGLFRRAAHDIDGLSVVRCKLDQLRYNNHSKLRLLDDIDEVFLNAKRDILQNATDIKLICSTCSASNSSIVFNEVGRRAITQEVIDSHRRIGKLYELINELTKLLVQHDDVYSDLEIDSWIETIKTLNSTPPGTFHTGN